MTWVEIVYWASTIIGGLLFLLRTALFFIAGDAGSDIDVDFNGGFDGDFDDSHGDTDLSFKVLSLQSLTAFFMMFGLAGLALIKANIDPVWTILGSAIVGSFTVWVISIIFAAMIRLQSEGTMRIKNAIGKEGTVYLSIPASGTGQVRVAVQGSLKVLDAVSANGKIFSTGERIEVVNVKSDNILVVDKPNNKD